MGPPLTAPRILSRPAALALVGIMIGLSATWCFSSITGIPPLMCETVANRVVKPDRGFILVGIMTAAKYVDTRAYNVWKTWANHINGKVLFFVAENTVSIYPELPLVRLKGVDDTYPPQKKSFAMLRWMADNHLNDFDWFVRADDDLYIRGPQLESFLRSLDASRPHLIGQAGQGNIAEYGLLALGNNENYCMGGPSVVLSRETMSLLSPHLESCLSHLRTTHEDVELGRCIRQHVDISCTWNYEMQKLFHNNQNASTAYTGNLHELTAAITIHPIKDPKIMNRVHAHQRLNQLKQLRTQRILLETELTGAPPLGLIRVQPNRTTDLEPWYFINDQNIIFCADRVICPRHTVELSILDEASEIINKLFDEFNSNARRRGRVLQFQSLQYGYMRVEPTHGVDYVLDMILWFKKFRPPHRTTSSVRRHAYVQQTFGPLQAIDDSKIRSNLRHFANSSLEEEPIPHIHIILPLRGRAEIFQRFATHLKNVCQGESGVSLVLVLYESDDVAENRRTAAELNEAVNVKIVEMGDANFSRGVALMRGVQELPANALLFFTDVDMLFTCDTLQRIRQNVILDAQVYFPIVFSEFSPESWSENDKLLADAFHYGRRRGYFRHFGYGLVALYKADLYRAGGLNTKIEGWGLEDVDFFERNLKTQHLRIIRAPEPGLVHIYHPVVCDPALPAVQKDMCVGSKAACLSSLDALVDQIAPYV